MNLLSFTLNTEAMIILALSSAAIAFIAAIKWQQILKAKGINEDIDAPVDSISLFAIIFVAVVVIELFIWSLVPHWTALDILEFIHILPF